MSSNDSAKNTLPLNVQVKIEPGTSTSSTSLAGSFSGLPYIKSELNTNLQPTQRLTSFRLPRDLTLSGNIKTEKSKKVYIPNINVQRKKKNELPTVTHESIRQTNDHRTGRGRGRGDRGRGRGRNERGRGKSNIIESTGIWSEGMYIPPESKRYSNFSDSDSDSIKFMEKPKLDLNRVVNKEEEEEKLNKLLKLEDNFYEFDEDERLKPFILPRNMPSAHKIENNKINAKAEKMLYENELRVTSEMIENKSNSYVLIEFPDGLPGLESSKEEKEGEANSAVENEVNEAMERCTLNSLEDGYLGKLEILKSGNVRLRFGKTSFDVDFEKKETFRQDVIAAKLDATSSTSSIVNLGQIDGKLYCWSNVDEMFPNNLEI